ncbi:MAG: DnaJ domain-containing protein [Bdellovibrionales bacterium]|nr:DnaJ domain-containing protein [Bdellovibrionales bacterium]
MDETASTRETLVNWLSGHFGVLQIAISVIFILFWLNARNRAESKSAFKLREADRGLKFKRGANETAAANAPTKKEPLRLDGIVKDGAPHEVLGVSALASEAEIQKAYKEKMKRYHPDRLGRPGSREWEEGTAIAESINRARLAMLERAKNRK